MNFIQAAFESVRDHIPAPWSEALLIVTSLVCGLLVGIERERLRKPAGLRTLTLICFGSTLFTLASIAPAFGKGDPGRIAAQIVTGVGFLGAGAIIRDRGNVTGLTTAATIWVVAAIGMIIGAGYALGGLLVSLVTPVGLRLLGGVEPRARGTAETRTEQEDR